MLFLVFYDISLFLMAYSSLRATMQDPSFDLQVYVAGRRVFLIFLTGEQARSLLMSLFREEASCILIRPSLIYELEAQKG